MAHTPEPWRAERKNWKNEPDPHNFYISGDLREDEDGGLVSTSIAVVLGNATSGTIAEDNAALIIAAPELLAACEAALLKFNHSPLDKVSVAGDMLRAAIAKARGQSQPA